MRDSAFQRAMQKTNALALSFQTPVKQVTGDLIAGSGTAPTGWGAAMSQAKDRLKYGQFHGHLYAVVNAIAKECAGQPVCVARLVGAGQSERRTLPVTKSSARIAQNKAAEQEWEPLYDHPFMRVLEHPNSFQHKWQFIYSFIANLTLTGRAYVVGGATADGQMQFFSLPSTWVTPIHKKGPYAEFKVGDPAKPLSTHETLDSNNVAFAYLPDPSNPMGAYSPSASQQPAIEIDSYIQASQTQYFKKGVFPSVVITMGKDPHPSAPGGGVRPRLSPEQRRQINLAIQQTMAGVHNYGAPAIVDGMIESIDRLSATANEMGWESSEERVRARILSAFGIHPMILGEKEVTNYATAYKVEERFYKIANAYLDMLSTIYDEFALRFADESSQLHAWVEPLKAQDESLRQVALKDMYTGEVITKNEYRAEMGFPPLDDEIAERSKLLDSVGTMTTVINCTKAVHAHEIPYEAGVNQIMVFLRVDQKTAEAMLGPEPEEPEPVPPQLLPSPDATNEDDDMEDEEEQAEDVAEEMPDTEDVVDGEASVSLLTMTPEAYASIVQAAAKMKS